MGLPGREQNVQESGGPAGPGVPGGGMVGRQCQLISPDQLAAEKLEEECSLLRDPAGDRWALP